MVHGKQRKGCYVKSMVRRSIGAAGIALPAALHELGRRARNPFFGPGREGEIAPRGGKAFIGGVVLLSPLVV